MREEYMATRDAVGSIASAVYGRRGSARPRPPWYLEPDEKVAGLSGADLEREVDRLAVAFPERVH